MQFDGGKYFNRLIYATRTSAKVIFISVSLDRRLVQLKLNLFDLNQ